MGVALLTWSSKYSVGVQSMDNQHTVLFGILNDLHEAMMKGQAQKTAGSLLSKLVDYTREHFTAEEGLMAASGYAGLAQHRALHCALTRQVDEYAARYSRGESTLGPKLLNFLRDWLSNHIQNKDKKYGPCLNDHNLR